MSKKDNGSSDNAAQARADEQARQSTIRDGTNRINSLFDGKPYTAPETASGPTVAGGFGGLSDALARATGGAPAAPAANAAPTFGGFTDDFFGKQKQAALDYYNPQVDQQYKDAQKQLSFSLARSGNLDSSTRADQEGTLQRLYDTNKAQVADQANSSVNTLRNSVEDARAQLISNLNATGDASGAASSALTRATALSQPQAFSPIANMFSTFTSGLGTQAALEKSFAAGGPAPTYNTGLFGNSNSVKVT